MAYCDKEGTLFTYVDRYSQTKRIYLVGHERYNDCIFDEQVKYWYQHSFLNNVSKFFQRHFVQITPTDINFYGGCGVYRLTNDNWKCVSRYLNLTYPKKHLAVRAAKRALIDCTDLPFNIIDFSEATVVALIQALLESVGIKVSYQVKSDLLTKLQVSFSFVGENEVHVYDAECLNERSCWASVLRQVADVGAMVGFHDYLLPFALSELRRDLRRSIF